MGLFGKSAEQQATELERLRREDEDESRSNMLQQIAALQTRVDKMTLRLTEEGLNTLSTRVATLIEDEFARGHEFGRGQRFTKVAQIVREALREIATGEEKSYGDWRPENILRPPA